MNGIYFVIHRLAKFFLGDCFDVFQRRDNGVVIGTTSFVETVLGPFVGLNCILVPCGESFSVFQFATNDVFVNDAR